MKNNEELTLFPTTPALIGKKIYLRSALPEDYILIHQWFNASDPQSQTCHFVKIMTPDERVKKMKERVNPEDEGRFVIAAKDDHRLVGNISYFHLNMLNRACEIGYLISPDERGNGYAREALQVLINYLFLELNLNKVYAQTASFNKASIKLLESLEFKLDGTLRQHHYFKGDLYDDLVYSLLRFEYGAPS